ncbi:hypothetical protein, partial [Burkholderia cenocepacia]
MMTLPSVQVVARHFHFGTLMPLRVGASIPLGKSALLHRTTAAFTLLRLGHESFAVRCPLALHGSAFYAVLVH